MRFKIGDKIVPKDGIWECAAASVREADYAIITYARSKYSYNLYKDGNKVSSCYFCQNDTNSKLMEKTMEDLQKGDVIVDDGYEYTVMERLGDIVFTTGYGNDCNKTFAWNTTELKNNGSTIKQDEPEPTELTMQEVADKFGVDVSKLKIKKG